MKKIISLMLVIVLLLSAVPCASAQSGPFSDVPKSHWAYASIVRAYEEGAVKGVGSGKFAPNRNITLAELTAIIIRIMYPEEVKSAETQIVKDSDLTGSEWYAKYYYIAYRHGIIDEYTMKNSYMPLSRDMNTSVNRYTMAKLLRNAVCVLGLNPGQYGTFESIPDYSQITAASYRDAVGTMYGTGIMKGVDKAGTFNGEAFVTRAQAATIYCRFSDYGKDELESRHFDLIYSYPSPAGKLWEGEKCGVRAVVIEDPEKLEGALTAAKGDYTRELMIFTHSAAVMEAIGKLNPYTPFGSELRKSRSGFYLNWDIKTDSFNTLGRDYYDVYIKFSYDNYVNFYLYRAGKLSELPAYEMQIWDSQGKPCTKYGTFEHLLKAVKEVEKKYGVSMKSSDYDKVKAIYDYITSNFSYDHTLSSLIDSPSGEPHTYETERSDEPCQINLPLQTGKGICNHFARLFQAMCLGFDVDAYYVQGYARGYHAWNIVKIDGKWYQCDATWDLGASPKNYKYFLKATLPKHTLYSTGSDYPETPEDYAP